MKDLIQRLRSLTSGVTVAALELTRRVARTVRDAAGSTTRLLGRLAIAVMIMILASIAGVGFVLFVVWLTSTGSALIAQGWMRWEESFAVLGQIRVALISMDLPVPTRDFVRKSLGLGITAFGGAALIGMLKEVSSILPQLWDYVRTKDFRQVVQASATVFVSMAALSLSIIGYGGLDPLPKIEVVSKDSDPPPSSLIVLNISQDALQPARTGIVVSHDHDPVRERFSHDHDPGRRGISHDLDPPLVGAIVSA